MAERCHARSTVRKVELECGLVEEVRSRVGRRGDEGQKTQDEHALGDRASVSRVAFSTHALYSPMNVAPSRHTSWPVRNRLVTRSRRNGPGLPRPRSEAPA